MGRTDAGEAAARADWADTGETAARTGLTGDSTREERTAGTEKATVQEGIASAGQIGLEEAAVAEGELTREKPLAELAQEEWPALEKQPVSREGPAREMRLALAGMAQKGWPPEHLEAGEEATLSTIVLSFCHRCRAELDSRGGRDSRWGRQKSRYVPTSP